MDLGTRGGPLASEMTRRARVAHPMRDSHLWQRCMDCHVKPGNEDGEVIAEKPTACRNRSRFWPQKSVSLCGSRRSEYESRDLSKPRARMHASCEECRRYAPPIAIAQHGRDVDGPCELGRGNGTVRRRATRRRAGLCTVNALIPSTSGASTELAGRPAVPFTASSLPPLEGRSASAVRDGPGGVKLTHPTPAARRILAADPPAPGG